MLASGELLAPVCRHGDEAQESCGLSPSCLRALSCDAGHAYRGCVDGCFVNIFDIQAEQAFFVAAVVSSWSACGYFVNIFGIQAEQDYLVADMASSW